MKPETTSLRQHNLHTDFPFGRPRRDYKEKRRLPSAYLHHWMIQCLKGLLQLEMATTTTTEESEGCGALVLRCSGDWCCVDCCCVCLSALSPPPFIVREGCWMLPSFILLRHSWRSGYLVA